MSRGPEMTDTEKQLYYGDVQEQAKQRAYTQGWIDGFAECPPGNWMARFGVAARLLLEPDHVGASWFVQNEDDMEQVRGWYEEYRGRPNSRGADGALSLLLDPALSALLAQEAAEQRGTAPGALDDYLSELVSNLLMQYAGQTYLLPSELDAKPQG